MGTPSIQPALVILLRWSPRVGVPARPYLTLIT